MLLAAGLRNSEIAERLCSRSGPSTATLRQSSASWTLAPAPRRAQPLLGSGCSTKIRSATRQRGQCGDAVQAPEPTVVGARFADEREEQDAAVRGGANVP